jgi:ADP-ribosyl-[dinitrogen reductase] hydrolase
LCYGITKYIQKSLSRLLKLQDRYRGCLLGLAIGDALGAPLESSKPGSFAPIKDMMGSASCPLEPGKWTDDTSMALCLAESLITKGMFDPKDQLERYLKWLEEGYLSSTGVCFGIGMTVLYSLKRFKETHEPYCGPIGEFTAGNGSLMRLAPVPLFYANNPEIGIIMSGESSRTTHQAPVAIDVCRYFGGLIIGVLHGNNNKDEILSPFYSPVTGYWDKNPVTSELTDVINGSFKRRNPPDMEDSGYVLKTLEAALWAFYCSNTFEEGCLMAVNLGGDTDTTAAVYGQLAGAFYGETGIPNRWHYKLAHKEKIIELANDIYSLSKKAIKN